MDYDTTEDNNQKKWATFTCTGKLTDLTIKLLRNHNSFSYQKQLKKTFVLKKQLIISMLHAIFINTNAKIAQVVT
jgi:hypothetical protein